MLTGKAKTDYQCEYMRRRRGSTVRPTVVSVRPIVRPAVKSAQGAVKAQSYNPMMVGYVPPVGGEQ